MAQPIGVFTSKVIPIDAENVDTDQIVPARYLKVTDKAGLADALFRDWRFEEDGSLKDPPFILDRPGMAGRAILLVGDASYYERFGFSAEKTGNLSMPGPYERHRFLALELVPGALDNAAGTLKPTGRKAKAARIAAAA